MTWTKAAAGSSESHEPESVPSTSPNDDKPEQDGNSQEPIAQLPKDDTPAPETQDVLYPSPALDPEPNLSTPDEPSEPPCTTEELELSSTELAPVNADDVPPLPDRPSELGPAQENTPEILIDQPAMAADEGIPPPAPEPPSCGQNQEDLGTNTDATPLPPDDEANGDDAPPTGTNTDATPLPPNDEANSDDGPATGPNTDAAPLPSDDEANCDDAPPITEPVTESLVPSAELPLNQVDDKKVSFVSGTTDPKPSVRKKKTAKGTKSRSKSRNSLSSERNQNNIMETVQVVDENDVASPSTDPSAPGANMGAVITAEEPVLAPDTTIDLEPHTDDSQMPMVPSSKIPSSSLESATSAEMVGETSRESEPAAVAIPPAKSVKKKKKIPKAQKKEISKSASAGKLKTPPSSEPEVDVVPVLPQSSSSDAGVVSVDASQPASIPCSGGEAIADLEDMVSTVQTPVLICDEVVSSEPAVNTEDNAETNAAIRIPAVEPQTTMAKPASCEIILDKKDALEKDDTNLVPPPLDMLPVTNDICAPMDDNNSTGDGTVPDAIAQPSSTPVNEEETIEPEKSPATNETMLITVSQEDHTNSEVFEGEQSDAGPHGSSVPADPGHAEDEREIGNAVEAPQGGSVAAPDQDNEIAESVPEGPEAVRSNDKADDDKVEELPPDAVPEVPEAVTSNGKADDDNKLEDLPRDAVPVKCDDEKPNPEDGMDEIPPTAVPKFEQSAELDQDAIETHNATAHDEKTTTTALEDAAQTTHDEDTGEGGEIPPANRLEIEEATPIVSVIIATEDDLADKASEGNVENTGELDTLATKQEDPQVEQEHISTPPSEDLLVQPSDPDRSIQDDAIETTASLDLPSEVVTAVQSNENGPAADLQPLDPAIQSGEVEDVHIDEVDMKSPNDEVDTKSPNDEISPATTCEHMDPVENPTPQAPSATAVLVDAIVVQSLVEEDKLVVPDPTNASEQTTTEDPIIVSGGLSEPPQATDLLGKGSQSEEIQLPLETDEAPDIPTVSTSDAGMALVDEPAVVPDGHRPPDTTPPITNPIDIPEDDSKLAKAEDLTPGPGSEYPPSPTTSKKSSSRRHSDRWERSGRKDSHTEKSSKTPSASKPESKRTSRHTKDESRTERTHKPSRVSMTIEELEEQAERRRRKAARISAEEQKRADEEESRQIRHEERQAARKAIQRLNREDAEATAREEHHRRRRRDSVRDRDARPSTRESKSGRISLERAFTSESATKGRSSVRTGAGSKDHRPRQSSMKHNEEAKSKTPGLPLRETPPADTSLAEESRRPPESPSSTRSHRKHRRRSDVEAGTGQRESARAMSARKDGDGPSSSRKDRDPKAPLRSRTEEKTKPGFFRRVFGF